MGDTYLSRGAFFSCDGIPGECAKHRSKTFVLMSHFRSFGLCFWHISEKVLFKPSSAFCEMQLH